MRLAAVVYRDGESQQADAILLSIAEKMRQRGVRIAGAVQVNEQDVGARRCEFLLEDLATGQRTNTSDRAKAAQKGCRLDVAALEQAVGLAVASFTPDVDLVIVNRFGKREADGRGFRPLIEAAALNDTPALVALNSELVPAWKEFVGGEVVTLSPREADVQRWCEQNLAKAAASRH
jgi:nucleoside-triphosphatase THEP1